MLIRWFHGGLLLACQANYDGHWEMLHDSGFGISEQYPSKQFISGSGYGLQINIDVKKNEYSNTGASDAGIKFYAHRKGDHPFLSAKGLAIPPGHKGYAAISLTSWSLLTPSQWGQCRKTWHADDPVYLSKYTMTNCQANCIANVYVRECDCVPMRFFINSTLKVCTPLQLFKCLNMTTLRQDKGYWYQTCTKCSVECDKVDYEIQMSYSSVNYERPFHSKHEFPGFGNKFLQTLNDDNSSTSSYIQNNYVYLNVFMKDISFTQHVQMQSISPVTILSDIGGNTGMFLGMSVITLGEILLFFVKCLWGVCSSRRRKEIARKESGEEILKSPCKLRHRANSGKFGFLRFVPSNPSLVLNRW